MDNPVLDLYNNNPQAFREKVGEILMQKVSDRLEIEKAAIASTLFSPQHSTEESPESVSDSEEPSDQPVSEE